MNESGPEPPSDSSHTPEETLSSADVKSRAASGVALLTGRGVLFQAIGLIGNLILARLLVPDDFGLVAIGLTVVNAGRYLANAGIGAALISQRKPPERADLRAITGLQVVGTSVLALVAAVVAVWIGDEAVLTAFMMLALPLSAFRTPVILMLQRRLDFATQIRIEATEVLTNTTWAIAAASLGFGAWSLATATVASAVAGTAVAIAVSPVGFLVPSLRFRRLRRMLGFGARFQVTGAIHVAQEVALTAGIGAIGGLSALGLWSMAARILRAPLVLLESMWGVGFPAFSRLMEGGQHRESGATVERGAGAVAVLMAGLLTPGVASAPALVPLLFGTNWENVSLILPGSALALALSGPIGVAGYAYLYALGDAATPMWTTVAATVVRLTVTFALLSALGVAAIGIGWAAGACTELLPIAHRVRRLADAHLLARIVIPSIAAAAPVAVGWLLADELGVTFLSACVSGTVALAGFLALMSLFARQELLQGVHVINRATRHAKSGLRRTADATGDPSGPVQQSSGR